MAYTPLADSELQPEAPITSSVGLRLRDNPIAMAARAAGSPPMAPNMIEVLTGSGNYTVPAGVYYIRVRMSGAGGGGGYGRNVTGTLFPSAGGGGGAYVEKQMAVVPGAVYAYVVGAPGTGGTSSARDGTDGGDTTFGVSLTAGGGKGGEEGINPAMGLAAPGLGGVATGGDININGGIGDFPMVSRTAAFNKGGLGGTAGIGGGAGFPAAAANAGTSTGGGGAGLDNGNGGDGFAGTIIVEY